MGASFQCIWYGTDSDHHSKAREAPYNKAQKVQRNKAQGVVFGVWLA
jgi:hypothetical protein